MLKAYSPTSGRFKRLVLTLVLTTISGIVQAFDHDHTVWDGLLKRHVVLISEGNASQVDYAGLSAQRNELKRYLDTLSGVSEDRYQGWSKAQRLAFLINAYNAFTVELILTAYPDIKSIKDLGNLFQSSWKKSFFVLLGEKRHLDNLEHELIREPGVFDEPRIHFAVNCASIGCPMLRDEAYTAERLELQLADAMDRFLSDSSRNRFDSKENSLQVSRIFDWYGQDFEQGHRGFTSLQATFARFAERLTRDPQSVQRIRAGDYRIVFFDYDWGLNDVGKF